MSINEAFTELMQFQQDTEALASIAGRLSWDQETMMPEGSAEQRATEQAAIIRTIHIRNTDPRIADWLDKITPKGKEESANIRLIKKNYEKACKVPGDLNASIARVTSKAHGIWANARQNENVAEYLPILAEIIELKIEKANALAEGDGCYDALIDEYEPNISAADISTMFQN